MYCADEVSNVNEPSNHNTSGGIGSHLGSRSASYVLRISRASISCYRYRCGSSLSGLHRFRCEPCVDLSALRHSGLQRGRRRNCLRGPHQTCRSCILCITSNVGSPSARPEHSSAQSGTTPSCQLINQPCLAIVLFGTVHARPRYFHARVAKTRRSVRCETLRGTSRGNAGLSDDQRVGSMFYVVKRCNAAKINHAGEFQSSTRSCAT